MNNNEHWTKRVWQALLLLFVIAIGARVVYGLLVPILPFVGAGVVLLAVYAVLFRRGR